MFGWEVTQQDFRLKQFEWLHLNREGSMFLKRKKVNILMDIKIASLKIASYENIH